MKWGIDKPRRFLFFSLKEFKRIHTMDDDLAATTTTTTTTSPGTHPPAVPAYILRGHGSPIHALDFFRDNAYLASGDADGWIVVWSLASKRAVAVWKAHEGALLGVRDWDGQRLVT